MPTSYTVTKIENVEAQPGNEEDEKGSTDSIPLPSVTERNSLSVLGLTYIVKTYNGRWWKGFCLRPKMVRSVLTNISMHLTSGQLTALLGNSGSGKTSLLNTIGCRYSGQVVGGVYMNNKLMTQRIFQQEAGYVMQHDRLIANLTVRETLTFTATLKFSKAPAEKIAERVNRVMEDIGLRHIADSKVGGLLVRGISGGERRRVSIATQLLQDPKLLLLDEPTTGLDTCTANYLVANLAELARKRDKIILMTIHQPRSDIFQLLDNVAILSQGELIYSGPSEQLVAHFTSLGFPCPPYSNPLDHYIDVASVDRRDVLVEEESMQRVCALKAAFVHSPIFRHSLQNIHRDTRLLERLEPFQTSIDFIQDPPGFYFTFQTLVWRMLLNLMRDKMSVVIRIFQMGFFAVFMWLFVFRLKHNQESIQDRIGIFYQCGQVPAYIGLIQCAALYPPIRDLYDREARDGLYQFLVFILAYFVHALPFIVINSIFFSVLVYWGIGLYPEASRFGIFYCVVLMMHFSGEMIAFIFMGIVHSPEVASSVTNLVLAASGLIASGFLVSMENMIKILQHFSYANIFKYSSEIFVANEFHLLELMCDEDSDVPCLVKSGDDYLKFNYPNALDNMTENFAVMAGFIGAFVIISMITYKVRGQKNLH